MSCEKRRYSKIDAMIELANAEMRRNLKGHKQRQERRLYLCTDCGAWHLTSMTAAQYEEMTKRGNSV